MSSISPAYSNRLTTRSSASKAAGSPNMDIDSAVTEIGKKRILRSSKTEAAPPTRRRKIDPSVKSNGAIEEVATRVLRKRKGDPIVPPPAQRKKLNIIEHDRIRYRGAVLWDDSKTKVLHGTMAEECLIEGDLYPAGSIVTFRKSDGKLETVFLSKEAKVQDLFCEANTSVHFLVSGDFVATLAKDQQIGNIVCKGGTEYIAYQHGGQSLTLADKKPQLIDGLIFKEGTKLNIGQTWTQGTLGAPFKLNGFTNSPVIQSGNKIRFNSVTNFEIKFTQEILIGEILFKEGTVCRKMDNRYSFVAAKGQEIDGIRCEKGSLIEIPFRIDDQPLHQENSENKWFQFTPESDCLIGGILCKGGKEVRLNSEKKVLSATLAKTQNIQGISFLGESKIKFMEHNSNVAEGILSEDQEINGIPCKEKTAVTFSSLSEKLELSSCYLSRNFEFKGIPCMAGAFVFNYLGRAITGNYFHMLLNTDYEIDGFAFKKGTELTIDTPGRRITTLLSQDHIIKGIRLEAGTNVSTESDVDPNCWQVWLNKDQMIGEVLYKKGERLRIDAKNRIYRG